MTPNIVRRGQDFAGAHPMHCRCRACKPPLVGVSRDAKLLVYGVVAALALVLVVL